MVLNGTNGAKVKDWPKRPSNHQLQEAQKKDSDRAITPVAEAVHVPKHSVLPGSLQAKQLCHLHTQLSLGQSCHRQKKPCVYARRVTLVASDSLQPCRLWPARLLCQGVGFSRQESWSVLPNTWCCQNPCYPSSCTTSTPGPHWGRPKSSTAASGANPSGRPTCRGGNKTTIETQEQCG